MEGFSIAAKLVSEEFSQSLLGVGGISSTRVRLYLGIIDMLGRFPIIPSCVKLRKGEDMNNFVSLEAVDLFLTLCVGGDVVKGVGKDTEKTGSSIQKTVDHDD